VTDRPSLNGTQLDVATAALDVADVSFRPLNPVILRLELIARMQAALTKRGHNCIDLVTDDLEHPYFTLTGKIAQCETYCGETFVAWRVGVTAISRPGQRPEWWYTLRRYLVETTSSAEASEHYDLVDAPRSVAPCRALRRAARRIDEHVSGRALLSEVYGPTWRWRQNMSRAARCLGTQR
jgi:hypothetical protein